MTFEKRSENNSLLRNTDGSVFSKTLLTLCVIATLIGGALFVFAADADSDGFDDTTPTATFPKDCDDTTAGTRPLMNNSFNFINATTHLLKICSGADYVYENSMIIINSSSNATITIGCNGNATGDTTSHRGNFTINETDGSINATLRNWILINGTTSVVTIENCTLIGIGNKNLTAGESNSTLAVNITNSSNVVINNFQVRDTNFGGVHIAGNSNNITIKNSEFYNITGNTTGNNLHDVIWVKNGANINISGVNISNLGVTNTNTSAGIGMNISTNNVILFHNNFSWNTVLSDIKSNGSNHLITSNNFGNATTSLWLFNSTNHTITSNNFTSSGLTVEVTNAQLYLAGVNATTVTDNHLGNTTNGGWCLHVDKGGRNSFVDNEIANCTGNVLINQSPDNNMVNNNVTYAMNWMLLSNNSFNLSLRSNIWYNSTAVGLEFINGTNTTLIGEHVSNMSMKGIIFNLSNDITLYNVSVESFNASSANYAFDRVRNATLDSFNSTRAGLHGLLINSSSTFNISNFKIINATHNALQIINSTNITSDYYEVTRSEINGSSIVLINVSKNSSNVNLSTLLLAGANSAGAGGGSNIVGGYGIYVNESYSISFHNITIRNTSNTSITYSNSTGTSVIGFCTVANSSLSTFNIIADQTTFSTFNCTRIENANMSGVTLRVSSSTGTGVGFNVGVNFTGILGTYVNVSSPDLVYVNTTALGGGLLPANITMNAYGYDADGVLVDYEDDGSFHGCGINCTMSQTGLSLLFNVSHFSSYQASRKVSGNRVSGGGGSGGGRGGGYKTIVPTATGVTVQLTNYDMGRIQYGTGAYQFTMKRAGKEEADLRVAQQDYKLALGKALGVDLDKDGTTDITISLVSVTHNLATFVVRLGASAPVAAPAFVAAPVAEPSAPSAPLEPTGAAVEEVAPALGGDDAGIAAEAPYAAPKKKLGASTVMAVIVAVIVVLLLVMHFRKKKQAF